MAFRYVSLETSSFLIFVFTFVDQDDQVMVESNVSSDCFMATKLALAGVTCGLSFLGYPCSGILLT